jgi:hypothetical protein
MIASYDRICISHRARRDLGLCPFIWHQRIKISGDNPNYQFRAYRHFLCGKPAQLVALPTLGARSRLLHLVPSHTDSP